MISHTIAMRRVVRKRMNEASINAQITKLKEAAMKKGMPKKGWVIGIANKGDYTTPVIDATGIAYDVILRLECNAYDMPKDAEKDKADLWTMVRELERAGVQLNSSSWEVITVDGKPPVEEMKTKADSVNYVEVNIPDNWKSYFSHIYERDYQRDIIMASIRAGIASNWQNRFHVALIGPPAGGKTELLRSFRNMVGDDSVLEFDATATTMAGAIREIDERTELPRLLFVEEIEKVPDDKLTWLLSLLDDRAEIKKTVFRKNIHKETRMLGVCTVNNIKLFLTMAEKALPSRFPFKLYCPPPSKSTQKRFLAREIAKVHGNMDWADTVIKYAESMNIKDFRQLKAITLAGADGVLGDGEFFKKLAATNCREYLQKYIEEKDV